MKAMRWALPVLAMLILSSCFHTATLIKVNRDGSGTLEESFLLSNRFADMLRSLDSEDQTGQQGSGQGTADAAGPAPQEPQAVDIEKLEARAARMGSGVELDLAELVSTDSGAGYRAVFRFADINGLELRYNPANNLSAIAEGEPPEQEPIRFRLTPGPTATLQILLPVITASDGQPAEPEESTLHMLRQIYGDMRIRLAVEVEGGIIETDADYREGSTVTLMDLDLGRLMQDDQAFRRIASAQPRSLEDLKRLAAGNEALKIETKQSVLVRFR